MPALDGTATSCGCGIDTDCGAIEMYVTRICMMGLPAYLSATLDIVNDASLRSTRRQRQPLVVAQREPHFGRCNAAWNLTNRE